MVACCGSMRSLAHRHCILAAQGGGRREVFDGRSPLSWDWLSGGDFFFSGVYLCARFWGEWCANVVFQIRAQSILWLPHSTVNQNRLNIYIYDDLCFVLDCRKCYVFACGRICNYFIESNLQTCWLKLINLSYASLCKILKYRDIYLFVYFNFITIMVYEK